MYTCLPHVHTSSEDEIQNLKWNLTLLFFYSNLDKPRGVAQITLNIPRISGEWFYVDVDWKVNVS